MKELYTLSTFLQMPVVSRLIIDACTRFRRTTCTASMGLETIGQAENHSESVGELPGTAEENMHTCDRLLSR